MVGAGFKPVPTSVVEQDKKNLFTAKDTEDAKKRWSDPHKKVKVDFTQHQFDALTSLIFTIGGDAFRKSTLLSLLDNGDYNGAADQFPAWNKVKVRGVWVSSASLTKRRKFERVLLLYGDYQ